MSIYFIRNTRSFLLSVSVFALCSQFDGFTPNAYALEPSGPDEIDGLVEGQTTYGPNGYWKPYVEADGFIWDKAANNGNLRLWSPLIQNPDWILHTTIGGGFFETDGLQGTAGIGFRHVVGDAILGVYGFADVTFTEHGNTFWRVSPGIELLGLNYEARINAYIPIGEDQYLVGNSVAVGGGGAMSGLLEYETNFLGIDGEIGFRLPVEIGEEKLHDFWLYGGANYYDHEETDELYGADARFEWRINKLTEEYPGSRLSFIANASWNNVDDFDYGGGIRARIPLGKKARCFNRYPQERTIDCPTRNGRMDAAVIRRTRGDSVIVQNEILFDPETDVDMLTVVTVGDGDASLVLGDPPVVGLQRNFTTLDGAAAATDEVLIVVDGDATPAGGYGSAGGTTVDSNTTVLGTGTTIPLVGRTSLQTYSYMVAGAQPLFDFVGNGPTLTLGGSGIHVAGLEVNASPPAAGLATFSHGIFIATDPAIQSTNISIEQNDFSDIAADGIATAGPINDIRIFDNTFENIGEDGIDFEAGNDDVQIYRNAFGDITGDAISFGFFNDNILIEQNEIGFLGGVAAPVGGEGISFNGSNGVNGQITIQNNDIRNTVGNAISFVDNNSNITIFENDISDVGRGGVLFSNGSTNVLVADNEINGTGAEGIRFNGNNILPTTPDIITITGNNVYNIGLATLANNDAGIWIGDDIIGLTISDNEVVGADGSGIRVGNGVHNIIIDQNDIWDVGPSGITVANSSNVFGGFSRNLITGNTLHNIINVGREMRNGIALVSANGAWDIDGNSIFGASMRGISLGGTNRDVNIINNLIDGTDWRAAGSPATGLSTGSAYMLDGILLAQGGNQQIRIGGTPLSGNAFSNQIFDVTGNGININANGSANIDIEVEFNEIRNADAVGIRIAGRNVDVEIFNNTVSDSRNGIQLNGDTTTTGPLPYGNNDVTIQRNLIQNSRVAGLTFSGLNLGTSVINNDIIDVNAGSIGGNGDAIQVLGDNNTFTFVTDNTFSGTINRSVFHILGDNTDFLSPALNIQNDASLVAAGAQDCRIGGGSVGTVGNVQLTPVGGGAVITCP